MIIKFYNYLFLGNYYMIKAINNPNPNTTSVVLSSLIFFVHILMVLAILREITVIFFLPHFKSKYEGLIIAIPFLILTSLYLSKNKINGLLIKFEEWSPDKKRMSAILAFILLVIPIIITAVLSSNLKAGQAL